MIQTVGPLTRDAFLARFKNPHIPVVIKDVAKNWRASQVWTPDYFKQACGNEVVDVYVDREGNPEYETRFPKATARMKFGEYVDWVDSVGSSNDKYIHAQNHFLKSGAGSRLVADIAPVPDYLNNGDVSGMLFWLGPKGTITPLHHDACDILFCQVAGTKRFTLLPPSQDNLVYMMQHPNWAAEVNPENPDFNRHPLYRQATPEVVDLGPGDGLFLPVPWWHHVRALDMSISVSFTSFR